MALLLHRLGRFAYRRAWIVILTWVLAVGALVGAGLGLGGKFQESYSIPGTESQAAIDQLAAVFPETAGATARAVVEAPDGASVEDPPYKAAIARLESDIKTVPGVANASARSTSTPASRSPTITARPTSRCSSTVRRPT